MWEIEVTGKYRHACQLPHIWGIFTHFWPYKWVCHSFTHSADLPLIFEEQPLILMIFATHFQSHRLWGCEIDAHPEYLGFQITHFEKFWLASQVKHVLPDDAFQCRLTVSRY